MGGDLRYPIGPFNLDVNPTADERRRSIDEIAAAPLLLREAVHELSDDQLDTPYRPGGWTVRQVVHHVPESHMNAYVRFKLALTEDKPTIRPYQQDLWAELPDVPRTPVRVSLSLLEALHERWVILLRSLEPAAFARKFLHPELGELDLNKQTALYAWHGRHHAAQITSLRKRMGW